MAFSADQASQPIIIADRRIPPTQTSMSQTWVLHLRRSTRYCTLLMSAARAEHMFLVFSASTPRYKPIETRQNTPSFTSHTTALGNDCIHAR